MTAVDYFGPGTIVAGKYRCERELGAGGMGRVFEATHLVLRTRVALKILTLTSSADARRRFLREASLAVRLQNVHVARVYDAGETESGVPYIAMELLEGTDLSVLSAARGALPFAEACSYVRQACEGVAEAHALGMVHRDLKLPNLFLAGGVVKVLDFGCAKAEPASEMSAMAATSADALIGTPKWMAPEQLLSSRDVDARVDVWSLGVVLYKLVTGRMPFEGSSIRETFEAVVNRPPAPLSTPLPSGLEAVIDRCLRKRREERFQSANELAAALAPFTKPASSGRGAKIAAIIAVALASTAVGAALVLARVHMRTPLATPRAPEPVPVASVSVTSIVPTPTPSDSPTVREPAPLATTKPRSTATPVTTNVPVIATTAPARPKIVRCVLPSAPPCALPWVESPKGLCQIPCPSGACTRCDGNCNADGFCTPKDPFAPQPDETQ